MLSVVHNYYLLALLIIHSFRTSICVCKYLYMLSVTFDDRRGAGLMTLTFPLTLAGPGPTSVALKFYIFSAEIAIPLRLMRIPVFHPGATVSVHTIDSLVIRRATAGRAAHIIQLPALLLQSICRKTTSWRYNYPYHLQHICNIKGPLSH